MIQSSSTFMNLIWYWKRTSAGKNGGTFLYHIWCRLFLPSAPSALLMHFFYLVLAQVLSSFKMTHPPSFNRHPNELGRTNGSSTIIIQSRPRIYCNMTYCNIVALLKTMTNVRFLRYDWLLFMLSKKPSIKMLRY